MMFCKCLADLVGRAYVSEIPLRMGVAFGEMFVDTEKNILVGKPIADAAALEKEQQWVGGAFHSSIPLEVVRIDGIGVVYPVPLKQQAPGLCCAAVDWCYFGSDSEQFSALEAATSTYLDSAPCDSVRQKYLNTQQFYRFRREHRAKQ